MAATKRTIEAHIAAGKVAVLLDKSSRWVKDAVKDGTLRGFKDDGGDVFVEVCSVNEWIDKRRIGPDTDNLTDSERIKDA